MAEEHEMTRKRGRVYEGRVEGGGIKVQGTMSVFTTAE